MATSASGVYSETLQSIVDAKLLELERKRKVDALKVLADGVKKLFGIRSSEGRIVQGSSKYHELEQKLSNLDRFLAQPRYDPSVSSDMLDEWEKDLHQQLAVQSARFEYASLYAQLVTEWLTAEKKTGIKQEPDVDLDMSDFEELETKHMMEARENWAKDVFEAADVDSPRIQAYLRELFSDPGDGKHMAKAHQALKRSITSFQNELSQPDQFNETVLKWVIKGLLKTDLLTEDKRNVLRDFLSNAIILNELADVLNLRMTSLDAWSWGDRVPLEQKRKIQGHITFVMHEDLLQAIFLQYIGVKWSVFLRGAFTEFINADRVWRYSSQNIPPMALKRREYFLGPQNTNDSLNAKRLGFWRSAYFMSQLPRSEAEDNEMHEGEVEAEFSAPAPQPAAQQQMMQQQAQMVQAPAAPMARRSAPMPQAPGSLQDHQMGLMMLNQQNKKRKAMYQANRFGTRDEADPEQYDGIKKPKNVTEARQVLLHLLSTEVLLNTKLYGNLSAFRGRYERWNPLLPHKTILVVMQHLGVSTRWLKFFSTFLEAPLSFADEDTVHHRKRGVPGSHALSDMLGEAVLFCLDLRINQRTEGGYLWRVHDDFWFWSSNHDATIQAWQDVREFSSVMGLTLDFKKSGSVRAGNQAGQVGDDLPSGDIRWGFLTLDSSSGRFEIDQKMVERHVDELHRQLNAKTSSIFSWIEAWNAYANTFFTTNFGKPANCFGQQHIDGVLSTLEKAQRKLFDDSTACSVVEYLKQTLATRFDISNIPEGYIFFPSALGGLELRNPFVLLLQLRDNVSKDPQAAIEKFIEGEREAYRNAKQKFTKYDGRANRYSPNTWAPEDKDTFFSFDEFTRYREEFMPTHGSHGLAATYTDLLQRPNEEDICISTELMSALNLMDTGGVVGQEGKCGINGNWWSMEAYWKWILGVYGPGILRKFGGLNIVDNGVLPIERSFFACPRPLLSISHYEHDYQLDLAITTQTPTRHWSRLLSEHNEACDPWLAMAGVHAAPQWDKPEPKLTSMPAEVIQNIFCRAIPHKIDVIAVKDGTFGVDGTSRLLWSPEWVKDLVLVSESMWQIIGPIVKGRIRIHTATSSGLSTAEKVSEDYVLMPFHTRAYLCALHQSRPMARITTPSELTNALESLAQLAGSDAAVLARLATNN
ncbi:uncharacterized protein AB675_11805 [Cyphellophora attinorum]|uniref:Reverse transcriptase domain-containing protein n=1 Tax=Cyphellophora attinorum TaxID=1664694 RepID=A0A0N1H496_9EURO|nr:uncharacterized protein AB675_11805 [Phialophora attinorum]KPI36782.1 hypothetical protein AB675_11805 [Phialophora attinorum]